MAAITLGGVTLPEDLAWVDQYAWQPVVVVTQFALTGALIVQTSEQQAGQPITLHSDDRRAWVTRSVVNALKVLQADVGQTYALSVRGEDFTVLIVSVEATPLWDLADNSDDCALVLKMIAT